MPVFTAAHARRKDAKPVDEGLCRAILSAIPVGAGVIDLGAGLGRYVRWMRQRGYDAVGYDAIPHVERESGGLVRHADLSTATAWEPRRWTLCVEVGEHVEREREAVVLDNLARSAKSGLLVSWAVPGQRGSGHVNCRTPEHVACELGARGWRLDEAATLGARKVAGRGWDRKLLVLRRRS